MGREVALLHCCGQSLLLKLLSRFRLSSESCYIFSGDVRSRRLGERSAARGAVEAAGDSVSRVVVFLVVLIQ